VDYQGGAEDIYKSAAGGVCEPANTQGGIALTKIAANGVETQGAASFTRRIRYGVSVGMDWGWRGWPSSC
jgi:hypothetical protein